MSKFVIITIGIVLIGGIFLYMNIDSKPEIQKEYKIVAFGDSITAGYGVDETDNYPSVLQERLRLINPNITIINKGISGETTTGGLERIDTIIVERPDIVLLGLGGNDMLRSIDTKTIRSNLENIITKLQTENIKIVLMGMKGGIHNTGEYRKDFNSIYTDLAEKYNVTLVPYFLEGVVLNADLNLSDRIHPNKAGYIKIVDENIMPAIEDLFL